MFHNRKKGISLCSNNCLNHLLKSNRNMIVLELLSSIRIIVYINATIRVQYFVKCKENTGTARSNGRPREITPE